jgi:hypothetical protein
MKMIKSFIRFGVLLIVLASFTLPAVNVAAANSNWVIGDFIGDQSFTFGGAPGWEVNYLWNTQQLAPVGQEFTPELPALNIVILEPFTCTVCAEQQWLQVVIRKNTIFGPIIGTSYAVQLDAANNETNTKFRFPTLVHLKPGDRYVIDVVPLMGNENSIVWYGEPGIDFYPGGNAIKQGQPVKDVDIWFEEGVIISTPNGVRDCHSNGWQFLLKPDNTPFKNQGECVRYVNKTK